MHTRVGSLSVRVAVAAAARVDGLRRVGIRGVDLGDGGVVWCARTPTCGRARARVCGGLVVWRWCVCVCAEATWADATCARKRRLLTSRLLWRRPLAHAGNPPRMALLLCAHGCCAWLLRMAAHGSRGEIGERCLGGGIGQGSNCGRAGRGHRPPQAIAVRSRVRARHDATPRPQGPAGRPGGPPLWDVMVCAVAHAFARRTVRAAAGAAPLPARRFRTRQTRDAVDV